jgi:multiple sugar transport system substrate-binding protein
VSEVSRLSRRNLLRSAAVIAAGAGLAACGVSTTAGTEATSAPVVATTAPTTAAVAATTAPTAAGVEKTKVTIRWQDWSDWEPNMNELMAMLGERLPNITVEFEALTDGFEDKTLAMMVAGTAPDVMTGWGPVFRKWADKGQLLDLQPFVDRDITADELADFQAWQWAGMVTKDTHIRFAVPYYINLVVLYYNQEIFDAAGVAYPDNTWDHDTYATQLAALTKKEGDQIKIWGGSGAFATSYDRFLPSVQQYGGHAVNPDDWTECWLGKDEAQEAMEWIRARMWDDNSLAQPLQVEGVGQAAGTEQGPWAAGMLATQEDGMGAIMSHVNESKFKWAIGHLPKGPARRSTLGTTDGWAVYKGTKNPEECWQFLQVLDSPDFQRFIMTAWAGIPCRLSLLPEWEETVAAAHPTLKDANIVTISEILKEGYPMTTEEFKSHAESETAIVAALQKIYSVGDTPVSYMKDIADQVTALNREA